MDELKQKGKSGGRLKNALEQVLVCYLNISYEQWSEICLFIRKQRNLQFHPPRSKPEEAKTIMSTFEERYRKVLIKLIDGVSQHEPYDYSDDYYPFE